MKVENSHQDEFATFSDRKRIWWQIKELASWSEPGVSKVFSNGLDSFLYIYKKKNSFGATGRKFLTLRGMYTTEREAIL